MGKKRTPHFPQYPTVLEHGLQGKDELVKCSRCKNTHNYSERLCKPRKNENYITDIVCPRCECKVTIKPI